MILLNASSVEHVISFDNSYEELKLAGKLEIMFGLTANEQINNHWLEIGSSLVDFKLYIRCLEGDEAEGDGDSIKVNGNLIFEKDASSTGSGIAYLSEVKFRKLLKGMSKGVACVYVPLGELGSSYLTKEINKFECKIQMSISQISVKLI